MLLTAIRRKVAPPVFPDEEHTRVARLLNGLLFTTIFFSLLDAVMLLIFAPEALPTFWLNGLVIAICGLLILVMRRGRVILASWTLCLVMWALLLYYLSESGTLQSPAIGLLLVIIIIGTILLGPRGTLVLGTLCSLTLVVLYVGGVNGLLTSIEGPPTLSRLFGTNFTICVATSLLMGIGGRSILESVSRARNGERILVERNAQLQHEIAERQRAEQIGQRLISILENTTDFVSMSDPTGKVIYMNQAGRELAGIGLQEDLSATRTSDYHPPGAIDFIRQQGVPTALRDGAWSGETLLLTRDNREIPISQVVITHRDAAGEVEYFSAIIRDITERKRAEEVLTAQRNLLRTVIDTIPDYVYAKDTQGRFTLANLALARSVGQTPEAMIGKTDFDFFPEDLTAGYFADDQWVIQSGQPLIQQEERSLAQDRSLMWASTTKVPLCDSQGKIIGVIGVTRNMTRHKQAEDALIHERKLMRTVIDHLPDNIFVKDRQGKFLLNNAESLRILNVARQEDLNGKSDFDFFPHELVKTWYEEEQAVMQSGQAVLEVEVNQAWRTDGRGWVLSSLIPLRDESGQVIGLVGINRDITERKRVEEALRISEERYRIVSELVSDHAFALRIEPDGRMVYEWLTQSLARITGYTSAEILELVHHNKFALYHPDDHERMQQDVNAVIAGKTVRSEYRMITKRGDLRWVQIDRHPVWSESENRVVRYYGIEQDITERKHLEAERLALATTQERVKLAAEQQRIKILADFIQGFSHDFNTPLATIKASLYLFRKITDPEKQSQRLLVIDEQVVILQRLIEQFLVLSRLETDADLEFTSVDVNEVVQFISDKQQHSATQEDIALGVEPDGALPPIRGESTELERAIDNIVTNAIQHTPPGGTVTMRTYRRDTFVVVEIRDTGTGIAAEDLPHIFERFFRADKARTANGRSGLGLTISQKIVEYHQGHIEVDSTPGAGSVFRICLPIQS